MKTTRLTIAGILGLFLSFVRPALPAQTRPSKAGEPPATKNKPAPQEESEVPLLPSVLDFEKHRNLPIFRVDGRTITLGNLARHLRTHLDPEVEERWTRPEGRRELNSPDLPRRAYEFADLLALLAEAKRQRLPLADYGKRLEARMEEDFRTRYLPAYAKKTGHPPTKASIPDLRRRHRRSRGLQVEIQTLLSYLVPDRYTTSEVKRFYYRHGDWFGGKVRVAHILVSFRDPANGRLKQGASLFEARQKVVRILDKLEKDASNFGDLAKKYSDDKISAQRGGVLGWLDRFEPYVPASVLRTAWALKDGQVSSPIESFYGKHLVLRIKFIQNHFILPSPKQMPLIRKIYHRFQKEEFLFGVRKRHKIERFL
ncbi:MAG TPA: hypothetical protein ENK02_10200 [Planctomycetes bacterium]|nr:hypothetical protein [Planctomycetota bacterium]